jgi:prepilin-type N-terminal cleavage/methylation domain-containing protein
MKRIKNQSGFTIVELLIVVVVIAILAAITIVSYNGIQNRAKQSAAQTAATQGGKKVNLWLVDNPSQSPTTAQFNELVGTSNSSQYQYTAGSNGEFCVTATNGSFSYYVSNAQSSPKSGACQGHGANGIASITNLATNPSFETSTTNTNLNAVTATLDNSWAQNGLSSVKITPFGSVSDSFMSLGGDIGGFRLGMEAGKTYTVSATVRLTSAQSGTLASNSRKIVVFHTLSGSNLQTASSGATNAAGVTRQSLTFSIPAAATAAWVRLYNGASSGGGAVWWDSVMLTEGSSQPNYADGATTNPDWVWNGTPHESSSTGTPVQSGI